MKKILFVLCVLSAVCVHATTILDIEDDRKLDEFKINDIKVILSIHPDTEGNIYIGTMVNWSSFDFDKICLAKTVYDVPVGWPVIKLNRNLYLKLDNDSIITLTCNTFLLESMKYMGYGIYTKKVHSLFKLLPNNIELLKTHKITKVRLELEMSMEDALLKHASSSKFQNMLKKCNNTYNIWLDKQQEKIQEKQKQQSLKENPLLGF